ncbi:MAG: hypothetical protein OJF51_000331 [Nitrospira sp.]|jgi:hypothetical protein|nr:MAG: hypothetical protein OJF51_000331 [Nitrospira sp.]
MADNFVVHPPGLGWAVLFGDAGCVCDLKHIASRWMEVADRTTFAGIWNGG